MLDDDGIVYYYGKIVGDGCEGFEPLRDFGTPNAGCTSIQYKDDDGLWKWLWGGKPCALVGVSVVSLVLDDAHTTALKAGNAHR
jgi:hypothetical protein